MFKRLWIFSIAPILLALPFCAPASAETYQVIIHNSTDRTVSVHTISSECMRRTMSGSVPAHSTTQVAVETETKEQNCWHALRSSKMEVSFYNATERAVVHFTKHALAAWTARGSSENSALRARVEGGLSSITVRLTGY